jgi:hypothetical protein
MTAWVSVVTFRRIATPLPPEARIPMLGRGRRFTSARRAAHDGHGQTMDAAGTRATERRAPVAPADARRLVQSGVVVTVEESPQRAFKLVVAPRDG